LGLFYLIWISCKNIELFQIKKSNLFPDFSLDMGYSRNIYLRDLGKLRNIQLLDFGQLNV
jgi:hypothetical protein